MLRPTAEVRSASKYILDQTKKNMTKKYIYIYIYILYIIDWTIQMWLTLTTCSY